MFRSPINYAGTPLAARPANVVCDSCRRCSACWARSVAVDPLWDRGYCRAHVVEQLAGPDGGELRPVGSVVSARSA